MIPTRLSPDRIESSRRNGWWRCELTDAPVKGHAESTPDRLAVIAGRFRVTYGELNSLIDQTARSLAALGIVKGDVVSWQLPNWLEAIVVHHATLRVGAVSNPIVPIYREREVRFILKQSRAKALFIPSNFRGFDYAVMVGGLRSDLPDLCHVFAIPGGAAHPQETLGELFSHDRAMALPGLSTSRAPSDVILLLYTSGTTADPKGVLHTHETLDYENQSIIDLYRLGPDDTVFMPSPLAHITGVLYALHLPFMLGASLVLQDTWKADEGLRLIEEHRCSFMVAATPFLHGLVQQALEISADRTTLRAFCCGGAEVPPELVRRADKVLGCVTTRVYGSTEFPTLSACNGNQSLNKRATTDGRLIGAACGRVMDEDGHPVPAGLVGDLEVFGPEMFVGYLDPSLNADAFTADGWFRTGDMAILDEDGYVTITGRRKDIIIRGGENISAKEVEDLIFEHPAIADVAVVGMPDPVLMERVCACIVLNEGRTVDLPDLVAYLKQKGIAIQKIPERLMPLGKLPRTASGKIQKFKLRDLVRAAVAAD